MYKNNPKNLTFSASKIDLWNQCELKFFAHVILGLKPTKKFASDPKIQLGSLLHRYFHEFYKSQVETNLFKLEIKKLDEWKAQFKAEWQQMKLRLEFEKEAEAKAHELRGITALENFYRREQQRDFKQPIFMEQWFHLKNESYSLNGRVDRIDRENDGSINIIDYKITDKIQSQEDIAKDIQLTIYALACKESLLKENANKLTLYYPIQDELITSTRSETDIENLLKKINDINTKVTENGFDQTKFSTNPAEWKCGSCAFNKQCPEFKERKKLSPQGNIELLEKIERHKQLQDILNQLNTESSQAENEIKELMNKKNLNSYNNYKIHKSEDGKNVYLRF